MYFGGMHGLNYFHPAEITDNSYKPKVYITDLMIFNESVPVGEWKNNRTILDKTITETDEIVLSYKDGVFSLEFAALNYDLPEKNKYAYMMEGVDNEWIHVTADRRYASYTNLKGGEYLFKVKASNNDGVWNDEPTELKITVTPPFWATWYFRILLVVFILLAAYIYFKIHTRNLKEQKRKLELQVKERTLEIEKQKEELEIQTHRVLESNKQLEKRKEQIEGQKIQLELQNKEILEQRDKLIQLNKKVRLVNQLKLRFFTNISHEFRTPLSLILGPLEKLMEKTKQDSSLHNPLGLINRNAQRLLHLVNQLMDFRKIEQGKMGLKVSKGNIFEFSQGIFDSFKELAEKRNIALSLELKNNTNHTETWFN
jgi:signal transduction histidine kinase